jgi:PIN domain nuclease of toxin-antitoxin system
MASFVLDASAVLAMLGGEPGGDVVAARIDHGLISSVNAAEVVTKLIRNGLTPLDAVSMVEQLPCPTVGVDPKTGWRAGEIYAVTAAKGLSLGDRICLALAEELDLPVLTADRGWQGLPLSVVVTMIR